MQTLTKETKDFHINNVSTSTRCDICHQNDCYNKELDVCERCSGVRLLVTGRINRSLGTTNNHYAFPIIYNTSHNWGLEITLIMIVSIIIGSVIMMLVPDSYQTFSHWLALDISAFVIILYCYINFND